MYISRKQSTLPESTLPDALSTNTRVPSTCGRAGGDSGWGGVERGMHVGVRARGGERCCLHAHFACFLPCAHLSALAQRLPTSPHFPLLTPTLSSHTLPTPATPPRGAPR